MISPSAFFHSLGYALHGIRVAFKTEQSFRIQTLSALFVFALAWALHLALWEWIVLLLVTAAVLILELLNSVLERLVDAWKPRLHPLVKEVKDMMAGIVLIASLFAASIGLLIFLPKLI